MAERTGIGKIEELRAEVRRLRGEVKKKDSEIARLKRKPRKPKPGDIISVFKHLGVEIPEGSRPQWREFWSEVIYSHRFSKRGLARKEMVLECRGIGHPWGEEPVRRAIVLLRQHGLLGKKGTHYPVCLDRLHEICG